MDKAEIDEAMTKLRKARFQILTDKRMTFFGVVMMNLRLVPAYWVQTAAVDGRHLFFNPTFICGLTPAETKGVVCHEVGHVTGFHKERENGREHDRWNIACDIKINAGLRDIKIELPKGVVYGEHHHQRMTAEEVYASLPKSNGGGNGKDELEGGPDGPMVMDPGGCGTMISPRDENGKKLSPSEARAVQHKQHGIIEEAARMAKAQGSMPAFVERMINESNNEPLPWQDLLRRFVSSYVKRDFTWRRPSRRMMGQGVYLPSQKTEGMSDVVIGVDTSGSISAQVLSDFQKEIQTIMSDCEPDRVHVVYCDAMVHRVEVFERGSEIKMNPVGGGGTNFAPVFDWVAAQGMSPLCLIFFTDLMGSFGPKPEYPTIWATTHDGTIPFGEKVYVNQNQ